MRVELESAFIIHRRAYRNTSWLLESFTSNYGLIALVAKGARRPGHRWRFLLEPFNKLQISFSGRGELMTLTGVEPGGYQARLQGNRLFSGIYLNEILFGLLHRNDAHEALFQAYEIALHELELADVSLEPALRRFELRLLDEIGYGLQLIKTISPEKLYSYTIETGPVAVEKDTGQTPVVSGRCLLALSNNDYSNQDLLLEMKQLLRYVLQYHMAGKPIKSRELFNDLSSNK